MVIFSNFKQVWINGYSAVLNKSRSMNNLNKPVLLKVNKLWTSYYNNNSNNDDNKYNNNNNSNNYNDIITIDNYNNYINSNNKQL